MDAQRLKTNCERLMETDSLLPVSMWVFSGLHGKVMCLDCSIKKQGRDLIGHCTGCPKAWRESASGEIEFWNKLS